MTDEQEKLLELLETFSRICEREGLRYYLAGGTLLGAVRHRGFIPWDDDIDVMMPLADYRRLLALEGALPEGIKIQSRWTDEDYPFLFGKLCDTKYAFATHHQKGPEGIYIDLFPLVEAKSFSAFTIGLFDLQLVMTYVMQVKRGWQDDIPYRKLLPKLLYLFFRGFRVKTLDKMRMKMLSAIAVSSSDGSSEYYFSPGGTYKGPNEFYPRKWFETTDNLAFENGAFPAPGGWALYLKRNYGDYLSLPPEEERCYRHK